MASVPDPIVEAELERLQHLGLQQLKELWTRTLGRPPKHQSADLVRWRLAYELQVRAYGGLELKTVRRLRRLNDAFSANPNYFASEAVPFQPGTLLTRHWKGKTHQVAVLDEGFEYDGKRYRALSEIARVITGTNWSGPVFFGLRKKRS